MLAHDLELAKSGIEMDPFRAILLWLYLQLIDGFVFANVCALAMQNLAPVHLSQNVNAAHLWKPGATQPLDKKAISPMASIRAALKLQSVSFETRDRYI